MGRRYFEGSSELENILDKNSPERAKFLSYLHKAAALVKDNSVLIDDIDHIFPPVYLANSKKLERFEDLTKFLFSLNSDSIRAFREIMGAEFEIADTENKCLYKSAHIDDGLTNRYKFIRILKSDEWSPITMQKAKLFENMPEKKGRRYGTINHTYSSAYMDAYRIKSSSMEVDDDKRSCYLTSLEDLESGEKGLMGKIERRSKNPAYAAILSRAIGRPIYILDPKDDAAITLEETIGDDNRKTYSLSRKTGFRSGQPILYAMIHEKDDKTDYRDMYS